MAKVKVSLLKNTFCFIRDRDTTVCNIHSPAKWRKSAPKTNSTSAHIFNSRPEADIYSRAVKSALFVC